MAKAKEINEYLKESGYTRNDMKKFFDDAKEVNWIIQKFEEEGKKWSDLAIHQIKELPGLKERTLENIKKKEEADKAAEEAKNKKKAEKEYYLKNFESIMLNKIDNRENLEEDEISKLVYEYEVETTYGDDGRWHKEAQTVVCLNGRYFLVVWQKGLTEFQENFFGNQPYEVEKYEVPVTIIKTEWRKK